MLVVGSIRLLVIFNFVLNGINVMDGDPSM